MSRQTETKQNQGVLRRRLPPQHQLHELFDYDPKAGRLLWRPGRGRRCHGPAGNVKADGYRRIMVDWVTYKAHRLTYKWHHGSEPAYVDHRNRNKSDDRIENLRAATSSQNNFNAPMRFDNTSGTVGVTWEQWQSGNGAWLAYIGLNSQLVRLGRFNTLEAAVAARRAAELEFYGGDPRALPIDTRRPPAKQLELFEEAV